MWFRRVLIAAIFLGVLSGISTLTPDASAGPKKHCPPGLAKKGSCIPPGLQKGDRIPSGVRFRVVYFEELDLRRPRSGEIYIDIGGRIYLLAEATQRVIEAIDLVGAATR